jgi:phosphatidylglycerol:prolipoprotein diacylglycerol transferase
MYLHNLDPFAIKFTETFGIRWYGLAYLAGFAFGYLMVRFLIRRGASPLDPRCIGDFVFWTAFGAIIGGRLGYVFLYRPELILDFRAAVPFWGVLAIHEGGMASHGGIAGVIIASILFARQHALPALHVMDLATLGGALGIGCGRLANFINGELVGRSCAAAYQWCMKFPGELYYASASSLEKLSPAVEFLGIQAETWRNMIARGETDRIVGQLILEIRNGSDYIASQVALVLEPRHPYPLYASVLEGFLVFAVLWFLWRVPRKPGFIAASFLVVYAIGRIIGESFRMPDAHIGFQALGLTRGQWLSFIPLLIGITGHVLLARSKNAAKIGGWKSGRV